MANFGKVALKGERKAKTEFKTCRNIVLGKRTAQIRSNHSTEFASGGRQRADTLKALVSGAADNDGNHPDIGNQVFGNFSGFFARQKGADAFATFFRPGYQALLHLVGRQGKVLRTENVGVNAHAVVRGQDLSEIFIKSLQHLVGKPSARQAVSARSEDGENNKGVALGFFSRIKGAAAIKIQGNVVKQLLVKAVIVETLHNLAGKIKIEFFKGPLNLRDDSALT